MQWHLAGFFHYAYATMNGQTHINYVVSCLLAFHESLSVAPSKAFSDCLTLGR